MEMNGLQTSQLYKRFDQIKFEKIQIRITIRIICGHFRSLNYIPLAGGGGFQDILVVWCLIGHHKNVPRFLLQFILLEVFYFLSYLGRVQ